MMPIHAVVHVVSILNIVKATFLKIGEPRNLFEIHPHTKQAVLFAGGIGITPILSMAYRLKSANIPFELHYFVRSHEMIAFYGNLSEHFGDQVHFHIQDQSDTECNMVEALGQASLDKHLCVWAYRVYAVCHERGRTSRLA